MWRFIFVLSDPEKDRRRELLDWYGQLAQLSALLPLLVVAIYRFTHRRLLPKSSQYDIPSSPHLKAARPQGSTAHGLNTAARTFFWWCGNPVYLFNYPLGTNGEILTAIVWMGWLLILCAVQTGDDYMHLTKRFGIVGASQLPLHYMLAWKSHWSPIALLTGRSWEGLNRIHQMLGRVITTLFSLHAAFYLNFFIRAGFIANRIKDRDVILGLTAITCFAILGSTALNIVRDKNYRVFFIAHVSIALLIFPILYFHVSHLRVYILESALIWLLGAALRRLTTTTTTATPSEPAPGLLQLSFPKPARPWHPGQHIYLSSTNPLLTNPFTIASLPSDPVLRVVVRVLSGPTRSLAHRRALRLEGPYGPAHHLAALAACDRILFVAGGVGGTFVVPLYRALDTRQRAQAALVWAVRRERDAAWAAGEEVLREAGVRVHVTGSGEEGRDEVEMQGLLGGEGEEDKDGVVKGRPEMRTVVEEVFAHSPVERVGVYVCGPRGMGTKVRQEVGRYVAAGRDVVFWNEEFGLA